jgi:hypothetical protein
VPETVKRFLGITRAQWIVLVTFILARAGEPGTIRMAILAVGATVGVRIAPERAEAIGWVGMGLAIAIGILTRETPRRVEEKVAQDIAEHLPPPKGEAE